MNTPWIHMLVPAPSIVQNNVSLQRARGLIQPLFNQKSPIEIKNIFLQECPGQDR